MNQTNLQLRKTFDGLYFSDAIFDGDQAELRLWNYQVYFEEDFINDPKLNIRLINVSSDKYYRELSVYNYDPETHSRNQTIIFSNVEMVMVSFQWKQQAQPFTIDL